MKSDRSGTQIQPDRARGTSNCMGLLTFSHLVIWDQVSLAPDHKPLECLYSKKSRLPACIERWVLLMQVFDYKIEYKPGSENIAGSLSRLSCCQSRKEEKMRNVAEEYVRFLAQTVTSKAMTTREVEKQSHHDAELSEVR